jgi:NNP family nitrate/nitrite transporter-like MFS transporter
MFMFALSLVCLLWMHLTVQKMMREKHPEDMQKIEQKQSTLLEGDAKEAGHVH